MGLKTGHRAAARLLGASVLRGSPDGSPREASRARASLGDRLLVEPARPPGAEAPLASW